jgi:hypothetical protein
MSDYSNLLTSLIKKVLVFLQKIKIIKYEKPIIEGEKLKFIPQ